MLLAYESLYPVGPKFDDVWGCARVGCRAMASCHATVWLASGLSLREDCVRRQNSWPSVAWQIYKVPCDYFGRQLIGRCDLSAGSADGEGSWWYGTVRDKLGKSRVSARIFYTRTTRVVRVPRLSRIFTRFYKDNGSQ